MRLVWFEGAISGLWRVESIAVNPEAVAYVVDSSTGDGLCEIGFIGGHFRSVLGTAEGVKEMLLSTRV